MPDFLAYLNQRILGPVLPVVLMGAGLFFLIRTGGFLLRRPGTAAASLFRKREGKISPFRAACIALAGTLGVGNIAGVASAIGMGGPGAVFWMWVSGFFAMMLKYAEVTAAMLWKKEGHGGASYYMEGGLHSRRLGCIYAVLLVLSTFTVGNIVQSAASAEALYTSFGFPKLITGILFAVLTCFLLLGGVKRLAGFSGVVIPLLTAGYVILCLAVILRNLTAMPRVLGGILADAFRFEAAAGGGLGFLFSRALRYGTARGVLSNEAGCGTAAYAHTAADNEPAEQGFFGIFEVFVDTILLCSLSAFVILLAYPGGCEGENGMGIAIAAFDRMIPFGGSFVAASTGIYALASVVCWSYYGSEGLTYLGAGKKSRRLYLLLYSAAGLVGAVFAPALVWETADLSVTLLAVFNTLCLCMLSGRIARYTKEYFRGLPTAGGRRSRASRGITRSALPFGTRRETPRRASGKDGKNGDNRKSRIRCRSAPPWRLWW